MLSLQPTTFIRQGEGKGKRERKGEGEEQRRNGMEKVRGTCLMSLNFGEFSNFFTTKAKSLISFVASSVTVFILEQN